MMKYVVCGTSVEDVEAGVNAMKMAIANGMTCGVVGSTMAEVEKCLEAMKQMVKGNAPTTEDCQHCSCPYYDCEDEDEVDCREGYMAMTEDYDEISGLWDSPEDAMSDAIGEGYDLEDIYIYKVRVYDDDSVEILD